MSEHLGNLSSYVKKLSIEWKIEEFFDKINKCPLSGIHHFKSPTFKLSDEYFHIKMNICAGKDQLKVMFLHLCKDDSASGIVVQGVIRLKKSVDRSVFNSFYFNYSFPPRRYKLGELHIGKLHLRSIKNLLQSHVTLTVFCEIHVVDEIPVETETQTSMSASKTTQASLPDSFQTLSKDFEEFYLSGCQTDVLLNVKSRKFSANRFVLSSRSSVFRTMFEVDMKERDTGVVNITDCDPDSFDSFLLFLYSGRLDVVSSDNAFSLYAAADKYNVQDLKNECCECLARELSVDLVCDVLRLATLHEEQELLRRATRYFVKNASIILKTPQCKTLLGDNPNLANELFIKVVDSFTVS